MKYKNMTLKEFFENATSIFSTNLELFNYIKQVTNDFDIQSLVYFMEELDNFFNFMTIKLYKDVEIKGVLFKGNEKIRFIDLIDILKRANELNIIQIFNSATNIPDKIEVIYENFDEVLQNGSFERFEMIESIYNIADNEYQRITKTESTIEKSKSPKPLLTFSGLFKPEYVIKIDTFYNRLIANGYIDKNHIWRETETKNEPAKVYYWLLEEGVLKYNKPTPALICFCKEFGITAYKDNETTPTTYIRAVTVKNLLNTKITKDEKKHFENVFLSFLIK